MASQEQLLDYLKKVTVELHDTRARLQEAQARRAEPLAIVGIGCRLPGGVRSAEQLWELVARRGDAISCAPIDRGWEDAMGMPLDACEGGFVYDATDFDAAFFGISPLEATAMDPQQRLMLEVSWEAIEDAGMDPLSLRKSGTGVYVGTSGQDYIAHTFRGAFGEHGHHFATGTGASVLSGRVSYVLGLEGPALTVDTACSSSLVAVHLACQALRAGECDLALAGGSVVMSTPFAFLQSAVYGLASDGRCKAFAAAADGVGFSEGAGVLVLERLSDALRSKHGVLALVRSSALSQDGASNGISAPNALSQQRVIRQALSEGDLRPEQVDAVEAHGTGTPLGDPIEAEALLATYGQGRHSPLRVGSLKSNIGHTQAAAGVAGVIKMVMALRHGELPATMHVDEPSPNIDWSAGSVSLLTEPAPWPAREEPRRAGVSSFGLSGTNAHLILEEARVDTAGEAVQPPAESDDVSELQDGPSAAFERASGPWLLSAKTQPALRDQARRLAAHLRREQAFAAEDVAVSLAARPAFEHRAVLCGTDKRQLLDALESLARGAPAQDAVSGRASRKAPVAFVFSGQGSQWDGMALELLERSPVFAESLRDCDRALSLQSDWSIERALAGECRERNWMEVGQVTLFAVMVSLAALWRACGVKPDAVIGHSQGEVAAAHVAGALSLDDAMRILLVRSRAISSLEGQGAMAAVALPAADVLSRLERWAGKLSLAAANGPASVVVSGDEQALSELLDECSREGARVRALAEGVVPGHSAHVERLRPQIVEGLAGVRPCPSDICFCSTVAPGPFDTSRLDALYWYRNAREPVRFLDGVRALLTAGYGYFLEMSPHPLLTPSIEQAALEPPAGKPDAPADAQTRRKVRAVGSLRRGEGGPERFMRSLGEAWTAGADVDWRNVLRASAGKRRRLPPYAFQRQRYWIDSASAPAPPGQPPGAGQGWRYKIRWKALAEAPCGRIAGNWLIACPARWERLGHAVELVQALERHGANPLIVEVDGESASSERLAAEIQAIETPLDGLVSLLALDEREEQGVPVAGGLPSTLALLQALTVSESQVRLWAITREAVSVGPSDLRGSARQAMAWALARSFGCEEPACWGGLIDLPGRLQGRDVEIACGVLATGGGGESQLAIRGGALLARRLVSVSQAQHEGLQRPQLDGTALVTVSGGVSRPLLRWLAQVGAQHILLVGSIDIAELGLESLRAELGQHGTGVSALACELADEAQLQAAIAEGVPPELPLRSVFHAAGLAGLHSEREPIRALTPARLDRVVRQQVACAMHLHELTRDSGLRAFVVFSSLMDVSISGQLGAHAACGAFLERLVDERRAEGLAAMSVAWGALEDGPVSAEVEQRYRGAGVNWMDPERALAAMAEALVSNEAHVVLADVDWPRVRHVFAAAGEARLISDLPAIRRLGAVRDGGPADEAELAARLEGAAPHERERTLLEHVREQVAALLGHASGEEIDPQRPLIELGLDSISAVDLRGRLCVATGVELAATAVFEHPTAAALTSHLLAALDSTSGGDPPGSGTLVERLARACAEGEVRDMLRSLAERQGERDGQAECDGRPEPGIVPSPVRLCSGAAVPRLICLPSALALSGPHQYVRFARALRGERDVYALALSGFSEGEWLPESIDVVLAAHAGKILEAAREDPFVLVGYSSGGLLAHALAERLLGMGAPVVGVAMIDTYPLEHVTSEERLSGIARQMLAREGSYVPLTDRRLIAMAVYLRVLGEWQPVEIDAPRLLIRASEPMPGFADAEPIGAWKLCDATLDVPGDHFTMMEHHAATTARAVGEWLLDIRKPAGARA